MGDFGSLRTATTEKNFAVFGTPLPIQVTLPDANPGTPIDARGIWLEPVPESVQIGVEFQRRKPRRIMALIATEVPHVPIGTIVIAPWRDGEADRVWRVDGVDRLEREHIRVTLIEQEC